MILLLLWADRNTMFSGRHLKICCDICLLYFVTRTQAPIFILEVDISAYSLTQINVILSYEARIRTFVN